MIQDTAIVVEAVSTTAGISNIVITLALTASLKSMWNLNHVMQESKDGVLLNQLVVEGFSEPKFAPMMKRSRGYLVIHNYHNFFYNSFYLTHL